MIYSVKTFGANDILGILSARGLEVPKLFTDDFWSAITLPPPLRGPYISNKIVFLSRPWTVWEPPISGHMTRISTTTRYYNNVLSNIYIKNYTIIFFQYFKVGNFSNRSFSNFYRLIVSERRRVRETVGKFNLNYIYIYISFAIIIQVRSDTAVRVTTILYFHNINKQFLPRAITNSNFFIFQKSELKTNNNFQNVLYYFSFSY